MSKTHKFETTGKGRPTLVSKFTPKPAPKKKAAKKKEKS
jgi:hypothetical protein